MIQSLHKTLPSFTQTAVMHVKEGYVDIQRLEHYLQIFQSSSPSYLFMAGMERCVQLMESEGENGGRLQMVHFQERLKVLRAKLKKMKHLRILDDSVIGCDGVYDVDISKIIISTKGTGINDNKVSCQFMANIMTIMPISRKNCTTTSCVIRSTNA